MWSRSRNLWIAALALCAGCAAGQTTTGGTWPPMPLGTADRAARAQALLGEPQPAHRSGGWLSPAATSGKHLIYVSDFINNVVQIYPTTGSNPSPIGAITDGISGPEGSFV